MAAIAPATGENRRGKAALFLIACSWAGALPHWFEPAKSLFPAITLAFVLGGYGLRTVFLRDRKKQITRKNKSFIPLLPLENLPSVDVLVAARDEEAVVGNLVKRLSGLQYPAEKLSICVIDDGSQDRTSDLLEDLRKQFNNLSVIRRPVNATGGKSGALNKALKQIEAEWVLILDADAQLERDSLHRLVSYALKGNWSAVQLRKSVVNTNCNFLTQCQAMEMAMDAVIQEGRSLLDGVVELRGNGQLLHKTILDKCGGFNEDTVTDDLDLSFRLLLSGAKTGILWDPPVYEEAVENIPSLWKQRQRWAEGGLQRFFDYWPLLIFSQLQLAKKNDLTCFFLLQYSLPVVAFSDLITTVITKTMPAYWPLSLIALSISGYAFFSGCNSLSEGPKLPEPKPIKLILAITYLSHWFVVIPWVVFRMAIFPKKLVWAKTNHTGI